MWLATVHGDLSKNQLKQYRPRELKRSVLEIEPEFMLKLEFAKALTEANELQIPFTLPNLDELGEIYGQLGACLHAIKKPTETFENPKWWEDLSLLLNRSKQTLEPLVSAPLIWLTMNQNGETAYQKFKDGLLTYDALVALLKTKPNSEDK